VGNPGDKLELRRRWYPLNELMARSGPSQCKPDATVSWRRDWGRSAP